MRLLGSLLDTELGVAALCPRLLTAAAVDRSFAVRVVADGDLTVDAGAVATGASGAVDSEEVLTGVGIDVGSVDGCVAAPSPAVVLDGSGGETADSSAALLADVGDGSAAATASEVPAMGVVCACVPSPDADVSGSVSVVVVAPWATGADSTDDEGGAAADDGAVVLEAVGKVSATPLEALATGEAEEEVAAVAAPVPSALLVSRTPAGACDAPLPPSRLPVADELPAAELFAAAFELLAGLDAAVCEPLDVAPELLDEAAEDDPESVPPSAAARPAEPNAPTLTPSAIALALSHIRAPRVRRDAAPLRPTNATPNARIVSPLTRRPTPE